MHLAHAVSLLPGTVPGESCCAPRRVWVLVHSHTPSLCVPVCVLSFSKTKLPLWGTLYLSFLPPWPPAPSLVESTWGQHLVWLFGSLWLGRHLIPLPLQTLWQLRLCVGSHPTLSPVCTYPGHNTACLLFFRSGLDKPSTFLSLPYSLSFTGLLSICNENYKNWTPWAFMKSILKHLECLATDWRMESAATFNSNLRVFMSTGLCVFVCPVFVWVSCGWWAEGVLDPKKLELHLVVSCPTPVLWKRKKFPYPPSHLSSSWLTILVFMAMLLKTRV